MPIRIPPAGDRPSWWFVAALWIGAALVLAFLAWMAYRTSSGEGRPIVEEPARTKSIDGQPIRPKIASPAQPKE